jgi:hypothetical protein
MSAEALLFPTPGSDDYHDCMVRGRLQREIGEYIVDQLVVTGAQAGLDEMRAGIQFSDELPPGVA